jgi:hypothetical protein
MKEKAPVVSTIYAGNTTFVQTDHRNYFFLFATDALTINFGGGSGSIPIAAGGFFEPRVIPTTTFTVFTTGAFIFLSDSQETS